MSTALADPLLRLLRQPSVRYLIIGQSCFLLDASVLYALHSLAGLELRTATAAAFGVAFAVNFLLTRSWVFRAHGLIGLHMLRYACLVGLNLGLTVLLIAKITGWGVPYLGAKVLCSVALFVVNYALSRYWIFREARPKPSAREPHVVIGRRWVQLRRQRCQVPGRRRSASSSTRNARPR
ncbi:GtrA family protein [Longispora albida]|uniref:GtrA family protein n=1 Tax=Longispora albida TaxID=203523 RepID=UPI0012FC1978|nr:GtrA family protein [Longispora albida]